jgi:hypothetical protein
MQVNALTADADHVSNLLGASLKTKKGSQIGPDHGMQTAGIATQLSTLKRLVLGLFWKIDKLTTTTPELATDGNAVSAQQSGDLTDSLLVIKETSNLATFFSAEEVVHWATWTW